MQDDPTIENAMASLNSSEGSMATLRFLPRVDAELPYARQSRASGGETTMNPPPNRRRMSPEELQSAADHIRMGNGDYNPDQYGTLTVTEGVQNGRPVYTVTSSRGKLKDREMGRAAEIFGWHGFVTPLNDIRRIARSQTDWHAEQRGIRATAHQDERRQASSNVTPDTRAHPTVLHVGAACPGCAAAQRNAGVTNVTGTVEGGGRFNNPQNPLAWKRWRDG